jgi:hypothetical protein
VGEKANRASGEKGADVPVDDRSKIRNGEGAGPSPYSQRQFKNADW